MEPNLLTHFNQYLNRLRLSGVSRKLYRGDIAKFLTHLGNPTLTLLLDPSSYTRYLDHLREVASNPSLIRRTQAALKQFSAFVGETYHSPSPMPAVQVLPTSPNSILDKYIKLFINYLTSLHLSPLTIKSYKSDIHRYFDYSHTNFPSTQIPFLLSPKNRQKYLNYLANSTNNSHATLDRKGQSLARFAAWYHDVYSPNNPTDNLTIPSPTPKQPSSTHPSSLPTPPQSPVSSSSPDQLKNFVKNNNYRKRLALLGPIFGSPSFRSWATLSVLLIFSAALGIFGYRQFGRDATESFAYPSTPVTPNRQLSFQGRLEDSGGTPITTATNMVFKLYTASSGGSELYSSGTCSIDPDADGVFSTQIGDTCGSGIASSVFTENQDVWLDVTVGAETLSPRQQIATVAYALNAETVQGFPLSSTVSAIRNTIIPMNEFGEIIIGEQSPRLKAVSGTFQISAPSLSFVTTTGSNGNISFAPDGTGVVNFTGNTTTTNFFNVSNAQLTTGSLITGTAANNNSGFKLLDLLSGSSPTSKFSVADDGDVTLAGDLTITGGNVTSAVTFDSTLTSTGILTANNTLDANGTVTLGDGGDGITIDGNAVTIQTTGAGSDITLNPVDDVILSDLTSCTALETDGSGILTCGTDDTGSAISNWRSNLGALSPINDTWDLLVGANATASAKFKVININSGTPTASISGTTANVATFVDGNGNLSTTNRANLTIGNSSTYNSTGTILINPNGTGYVGIGNTAPYAMLQVGSTGGNASLSTTARFAATANGSEANPLTIWNTGTGGSGSSASITFSIGASLGTTSKIAGIWESGAAQGGIAFSTNNGSVAERMRLDRNGNLGINTTGPDAKLDSLATSGEQLRLTYTDGSVYSGFTVDSAGDLSIDASGNDISFSSGDNLNLTAASDLIFGGTTSLAETTAANDSGAYLVGTFDEFDNSNSVNVQDVLDDLDAAISGAALSSAIPWVEGAGILYPKNSTVDLLVGGQATSSAKFKVININSGTPTASISGTTANVATFLTGEGNLATTNMTPLTIGGASTGPIQLSPKASTGLYITGTGIIGITTTAPDAALEINHATGDNLRLTYNDSNGSATAYTDFSLASDGDLTIDSAGGAINYSDIVNFAGGTTYYVDASGNAKFLDLQVADTGNPGLTVGDGSIGYIKVGGSTISDNAGNLTLDSDSAALTLAADDTTLTATGLATLDTSASVTWDATTLTFGSNATLNGGSAANDDLTLQGTSNATRTTSYLQLQPNGGFVTVGTTGGSSPVATLDVRSTLGTTPVVSISGATSLATLLIDQSGVGDLFTASASGATKFRIDKSGNVHIFGNLTCDGNCSDLRLETFTSDGTYTVPSDATMVIVEGIGAGGGGGGGFAGNNSTVRSGGGGGGGGSYKTNTFAANGLSSPVTVTVPTGGAGGSAGSNGTAGTSSTFGSYLTAYGGGGGSTATSTTTFGGGGGGGGGAAAVGSSSVGSNTGGSGGSPEGGSAGTSVDDEGGAGGGSASGTSNGASGGSANHGGGGGGAGNSNGSNQSGNGGSALHGAGGGGAGGSTAASCTTQDNQGGAGGTSNSYSAGGGGTAGAVDGGAGGTGNDGSNGYGGAGGGGGGGHCAAGATGGQGGNGGAPGGGGGGGGGAAGTSPTAGGGGNGGRGEIRVWTISSNAADLAEIYTSHDTTLEAGDVVALDSTLRAGVKKSQFEYESTIIGVVSTKPNLVIGDAIKEGNNVVPIALAGRVPVKVSLENGPINAGDKLTSSSTPGLAMKATKAGMTIGTAINSYHGEPGDTNKVMMFVNTSYTQGMLVHQILSQYGVDVPEEVWRSNNLDYSWLVLATMVSQGQSLTHQEIVDIYGDRVAATIEVIAPRLVARELHVNTINANESGIIKISSLQTIVDNLLSAKELVAQRLQSLSVQTNLVTPLNSQAPLVITRDPAHPPTTYPSGQSHVDDLPTLVVDGTLDTATLSARSAVLDTLEVKSIIADKITANQIEGLEATIATLSAGTTNSLTDSELETITSRIKDRLQSLVASDSATAADLPLPPTPTPSLESEIWNLESNIATDSAELTSLDADFATINEYLAVIGSATINSLSVTTNLFTDRLSSPSQRLELQPLGGTIALANNTLIVDSAGTVSVNGQLSVTGSLALRPGSSTPLGQLLQIYNEDGVEVGSIDASGSANLASVTTKLITIASAPSSTPSGLITTQVESNATAGTATLISPNTSLTIESPYVTQNSLVYLTPTGNPENKVLFVQAKNTCPGDTPFCTPSFTVGIDTPASSNLPFNWWIIQLE